MVWWSLADSADATQLLTDHQVLNQEKIAEIAQAVKIIVLLQTIKSLLSSIDSLLIHPRRPHNLIIFTMSLPPTIDPSEIPALKPPLGVTPNFFNPYTKGPMILALSAVAIGIMYLFVLTRFYYKFIVQHKLTWDDCESTKYPSSWSNTMQKAHSIHSDLRTCHGKTYRTLSSHLGDRSRWYDCLLVSARYHWAIYWSSFLWVHPSVLFVDGGVDVRSSGTSRAWNPSVEPSGNRVDQEFIPGGKS